MQFHCLRSQMAHGFDLLKVRVQKQTDVDAGLPQSLDRLGNLGLIGDDVQPSLGRHLLPPFRYERSLIRPHATGDVDHRRLARQFHVQFARHRFTQQSQITVLDVAAILAQVNGNPVGATQLGKRRGPNGIGS